jgi:helix-turn-helix protein
MDNQLLNHLYLGIFSRAEQRVLQAIFKAIADGSGQCVATVAVLARDSGTSKRTVGNTVAQAVRLGIIEKRERRHYSAPSLPNISRR